MMYRTAPALVATVMLLATAPPAAARKATKPRKPREIIAKVGSSVITSNDVTTRMMRMIPKISFHGKLSKKLIKKVRKLALKRLIKERMLYLEARRRRLVPSKAQILKARAKIIKKMGKPRFIAKLIKIHMSWKNHYLLLKRQLAVRALLDKLVLKPARRSDKQLLAYYKARRSTFRRPPRMKLRQVTFRVKPTDPSSRWTKAQTQAKAFYAKVKKGGNFDKLAKPYLKKGEKPLIGWVHKGVLRPAIERVALKLKVGTVSAPIKTLFGYTVLRVEGRQSGKQMSFNEVKRRLKLRLFEREAARRTKKLLASLRAKTKVQRFK